MRESEAGFTLIELAVVVAIVAIMVAASIWLFGSHPGALRASVDGFDQRYAEARSLAATSGNGATIVFAPRTTGPGYLMSVYSGRPTGANAVTKTNAMQLISDADISEAALGSPPFAIFLSSAGNASGTAHYPSIDNQGNVTFPVIAKQPTCPSAGGFTLTFHAANGATDVRKLSCAGVVAFGTAAPQPTMTPLQLRIDTPSMLAHWTTDAGPLHFKVGEFGYTHWFASGSGDGCALGSSDTGAPPAMFNTPYPYRNASATEMALAPAPPNAPYTWAVQEAGHPPDQPPGAFALSPVAGNGGTCTARIVDDHGQEVDAAIQVMGDLTPQGLAQTSARHYTLPDFASPTDSPQSVVLTKTFDGEQLQLQFGGACSGIVTVTQVAHSEGPSNASTPATTGTIRIAPVAPGSCVLEVTEQYGEPHDFISINVKSRMTVIPQYIEYPLPPATTIPYPSGITVGYRGMDSMDARVAKWMNAVFAGGVASAGSGPAVGTPCYAINFLDAAYSVADGTDDATFGTQGGCYVQGTTIPGFSVAGVPASAVEALGYQGESFSYNANTCGTVLSYPGWAGNNYSGPAAMLGETVQSNTTSTGCTFYVGDQANRTAPVPVQAKLVGCGPPSYIVPQGGTCKFPPNFSSFWPTDTSTWDCVPGGSGGAIHYLYIWDNNVSVVVPPSAEIADDGTGGYVAVGTAVAVALGTLGSTATYDPSTDTITVSRAVGDSNVLTLYVRKRTKTCSNPNTGSAIDTWGTAGGWTYN